MECQSSDSKKLFKVFDASKRKRTRKKREGLDDSNSLATDTSTSGCQATVRRVSSAKASLQDVPTAQTVAAPAENCDAKRDRDSSPSVSRSPGRGETHRSCRSPRRHRRNAREGVSLALKAGLVSTPRSISPQQEADCGIDCIPQDQDSFIYAFLEDAIKRDKKRQSDRHHSRRHEDRRSQEHDASLSREHRHHHRRRREDVVSRERDRPKKEEKVAPAIDQTVLFETFAKICAQLNEKSANYANPTVARTLSHKSLQCEVVSRGDNYHHTQDVDHHPVRLLSHEHSRENVSKARSQENCRGRVYSHERIANFRGDKDKCNCCYDKDVTKYSSKLNMARSKMRNVDDERYPDYPPENIMPRNHLDQSYRPRAPDNRDYREYDRDFAREKHYEHEKRRYCEQKTSRSFEIPRDGYPDEEKYRRTTRSDMNKEKHYDERDRYYEEKHIEPRDRYLPNKDRRVKRNVDRFDRNSIASREDDYKDRDRDRYSERERDSGLSIADGETSTISGKSNYLRVVKQEIVEQREAMDKMMKLWKELMKCFKGMSSTQGQNKSVHESAANAQESAAAQLRLWRECMRRYETVARDVGDTDARLMEEINKQRSEMAEMASMWQECLQRYREMSSDFNSLKQQVTITKQQLVPPEIPTRLPGATITCAEGEGTIPPAPYRLPANYPQMPPQMAGPPAGYGGGSPLRSRASAPPAWWWSGEGPRDSPRRRSSPESRGSRERDRDRDRDRHHRHKDRDDSRYKEKSSKPNAARSEHRHRKR